MKPRVFSSPPAYAGCGGRQRSRWLGLLIMLLLLGVPKHAFAIDDFNYVNQSKVHGSTIYTRWANWLKQHSRSGTYYNVQRYGQENSFRGWAINGADGRPTTWYYLNNAGPDINNGKWYLNNEDLSYWFYFKYENINEVTPDHPYVEIWVPTYDYDNSNSDVTKAGALYVTDADGDDVLVAVQQYGQRQIDNFYGNSYRPYNSNDYFTSILDGYVITDLSALEGEGYYNSGNYQDSWFISHGILTNWGTFNGANNYYVFGSSPEYVKLRYYPGYNMGESFDLSYINNWDVNAENNNTGGNDSYNSQWPRFVSPAKARMIGSDWTSDAVVDEMKWSVDWSTMFVTRNIKINNKVAAPTVERLRDGKIKISASGVKTYSDFKTFFVVDNVGRLDLGHNASGNATLGNGLDLKQPLSWHSVVYRATFIKNGSLNLNTGTLPPYNADGYSWAYYNNSRDLQEPVLQEFKNRYADIPGCLYPTNVQVTFDQWNKKAVITWELPADKDSRFQNGKFYVYRYEEGSNNYTLVGNAEANGNLMVEDLDAEYDKNYTYKVSFILNNWQASDGPEPSLTAAADVLSTTPAYNFDITNSITSKESSVQLSWQHDTPTNNTSVTFKVWRCLDNSSFYSQEGNLIESKVIEAMTELATVPAATSGTTTSYEDNTLASSCSFYWYRITADVLGGTFASPLIGLASMSGSTKINSFTANRGTYSNVVKVQWDVTQVGTSPSRFVVYRRLLGSTSDEDYKQVHVVSGTESSYFFEDNTAQPGQFYEYKVVAQSNCVDNVTGETSYNVTSWKEADGFCQSRGIISGRITYGTGTAVPNARVLLSKNSEGDEDTKQFYSLKVNPQGGILWSPTASAAQGLFEGKAFTLQMYVRPETVLTDGSTIFDGGGNFAIMLKPAANNQSEVYLKVGSAAALATGVTITNGDFANLSVTCDGATGWTVRAIDKDGNLTSQTVTAAAVTWTGTDGVAFGSDRGFTAEHAFAGYLDDIRLWSKALTDDEILGNYDRLLIGNEPGLKLYWPMDEGVSALPFAYDYSKTSGVANENHGQKQTNTAFDNRVIPSETQLGLYGKTDTEGNYVIRGIPFTGEGTNYKVSPSLGIHSFSPQYQTRFISMDALTHSGVDFEDVSSFKMTGDVYYENTNIPVECAYLYVDGTICAKDGEPLMTDETGHYEISVPIGDHYVQVKKDGHTFVNGGRFPADPKGTGTVYTFVKEETATFYDATKVMIAGRVVGGHIENDKPLGFGQSKANIGQAKVVLSTRSNSRYLNYIYNVNTGTSALGTNDLTFTGKYGTAVVPGTNTQSGAQHLMTITTDAATGEFAIEVPPLDYQVSSITIPSHSGYTFTSLPGINATEVLNVKTDSCEVDGVKQSFDYIASMKMAYTNGATMIVTDLGNPDGALGEASISGKDDNDVEHTVNAYTVDEQTGAVTYREGAPLLRQNKTYKFKIQAYQEYVNYDGEEEVADRMPMSGSIITIANDYASGTPICINDENPDNIGKSARELQAEGKLPAGVQLDDDELELDDKGEVVYQFIAGLPKTVSPYTRGCTIAMNDDASALWTNNAIILGNRSKGNDFVTGGPDEVTMILRDPGGSNSFATYSSGTTTSHTKTHQFNHTLGENVEVEASLGLEVTFFAGTMFFATETKFDVDCTESYGVEIKETFNYDGSSTTTTTLTEEISTSSDWDWTGAQADVFIGTGTNYIIGEATKLGYTFATDGTATLGAKDIMTQGTGFTTAFNYTQNTIENVMIPNLVKLRNQLIKPMGSNLTADTKLAKYESLVPDNDPEFGKEGKYKMIDPTDAATVKYVRDSVQYYNMQIATWVQHLANNEKAKVQAINNRNKWLVQNKSIDGGSTYTSTVTNDSINSDTYGTTTEAEVKFKVSAGTKFNGIGVTATSETTSTSSYQYTTGSETSTSQTIGYTLAEDGDDDVLTIDVFKAPDNMGPIFVTKGGRTSAPYEGQELTKYYMPGTEISAATQQIEMPELTVKAPSILQNVPSGRSALFTLELTNNSETDEDCWFTLGVCDDTNTNHASFWVSGTALGNGRQVFVPANKTVTMSLEMKQTDESILEYKNIGIRLFSPTQKDNTGIHPAIADTAYVSATFVPAGPAVDLALSHNVLNIVAGTDLTLTASGYDVNYAKLTGLLMEYRKEGDNQWNKVHEYVKDATAAAADANLSVLDDASEAYTFNMKALPDGNYIFRARTVCDFAGETVYGNSEEVSLVKDQSAPKLFGYANPADGILNADDEIGVTFNEDIVSADLSQSNFVIQAAVNGQQVAHSVALAAQNTDRAAYTESSINLAKKDFSADMWVNYSSAGTLLSHGNGGEEKFEVGTDADGHLVLNIGENTYTSTATLTKDKWVFLTFNYAYDGDQSKFSALFAEDATDTQLFNNETVAGYEGSGSLTLGRNITANIQELTLWDKARPCSEAKAEKDMTKKPSTPNLIGYWKMDEGDGLEIRDYARNRHLTMPQSTWYLNNVNIAANLDGTKAMKLDISACSALSTDDYAVELWFKSQQTGAATLFSAIEGSDDRVEMGFNAAGALTLTSKGTETEMTTTNLRDNAWHHLTLNVLRSGNATVYVDGQAVKTMSASVVSALAGANLVVGAKALGGNSLTNYFNGSVDEVRFWKATLSNDYIKRNKNVRLNGDEAGLVAYYPFEEQHFNEYQQSVVDETAADQSMTYNATEKVHEKTGRMATMTAGNIAFNGSDVPGLKAAPQLTNLNYMFVANERSIIIKLTDPAEVLEGTTVDFTVRYATDKNYNQQADIHWTAYVKQNQLLWQGDNEMAIEQQSGEGTTFEAVIENESGLPENWTLSGLPAWLTASATSGTLTAQTKKTIVFSVSESTAIGKYEQTIYLTGNNNIAEPLTIRLKVKGEEPNWTVNTTGYQFTMSIVGQLQFQGKLSTDEDDIVAAFNEAGDCVGVARPEYESAFDSYFTMMTVYGNNDGELITFKAYDASTGKTYPVVETANDVYFEKDTRQGKLAAPFVWNVTDKIEQLIDLKEGWNWMSLYVTSDDMSPAVVLSGALDILNLINGPTSAAEYDSELGWTGTLTALDNASMFKLNAKADGQATVIGSPADVAATQISVKKEALTWIGYPPSFTLSPADAFAGLDPEEDDMVKSQSGFSVYSKANAKWVGTLKAMEPGKGYMYSSAATADKSFTYPWTAPAGGAAKVKAYAEPYDYFFEPVAPEAYPGNMVMIGQVLLNGQPVEGVEVAAFVEGECRATIVSDVDGYVFLLVPGSKAEAMELHTYAGGEEQLIDLQLTYQTDQRLGTLRQPVTIDLSSMATGIGGVAGSGDADFYDLSGRKLPRRPQQRGIYIRGGEKVVVKNK